ncbi:MAG: RNA-binding protein [Halanaerobiales bacterium]
MTSQLRLGEIVESSAGRDKGKYYIIVGIEGENFVQLADGDLRRVKHPKRKNIKHLRFTGDIIEELAIWLRDKRRIRDEDLKKFIKDYQYEK